MKKWVRQALEAKRLPSVIITEHKEAKALATKAAKSARIRQAQVSRMAPRPLVVVVQKLPLRDLVAELPIAVRKQVRSEMSSLSYLLQHKQRYL